MNIRKIFSRKAKPSIHELTVLEGYIPNYYWCKKCNKRGEYKEMTYIIKVPRKIKGKIITINQIRINQCEVE